MSGCCYTLVRFVGRNVMFRRSHGAPFIGGSETTFVTQEAPTASKAEKIGAGNVGSVKLPTWTNKKSGAMASSQNTVEPHSGQK